MNVFITNSSQETKELAEKVIKQLKGKNLLCLYGSLGAGKTTFVQGLADSLGIKKRVISPTFVFLREYKVEDRGGYQLLVHVDCYRLRDEKDIKAIDLPEFWQNKKNLVVIEWAEKIRRILPKERIDIKFGHVSQKKRKIKIIN